VLRRPSAWLFAATYFCFTIGFWAITYFLPTIVREQFKVGAVAAGFISSIPVAARRGRVPRGRQERHPHP
jgi:nitrate/nitrite transporter NarK